MNNPDRLVTPLTEDGRYRLLVEAITDYVIYMLNASGIVSSWNPGAQRFKGYEPAEIVEDLYLGLRAGGALRKQRRGETLTAEEQEAIGRWQQMSNWRKAVAIGAFSVGTFGLGFTLGGLIFGRWRKA